MQATKPHVKTAFQLILSQLIGVENISYHAFIFIVTPNAKHHNFIF